MRVCRLLSIAAIVSFSGLSLTGGVVAQTSDQVMESILGPQWRQVSRRAGMIFVGTVLGVETTVTSPSPTIESLLPTNVATPTVQLSFRVEDAIAGVEPGQILVIHEWTGAWHLHSPITSGQRVLIFLYPPSRLGLTSPVGGSQGLIALDATGTSLSAAELRGRSAQRVNTSPATKNVTVSQMERMIRRAREE